MFPRARAALAVRQRDYPRPCIQYQPHPVHPLGAESLRRSPHQYGHQSFDDRIGAAIDEDFLLPAGGQGAVGIEYRDADSRVAELLAPLAHEETSRRVIAERTVVRRLDGGCDVPIASFAVAEGDSLWLRARVGSPDGKTVIVSEARGSEPEALGLEVADTLIAKGAAEILKAARS